MWLRAASHTAKSTGLLYGIGRFANWKLTLITLQLCPFTFHMLVYFTGFGDCQRCFNFYILLC